MRQQISIAALAVMALTTVADLASPRLARASEPVFADTYLTDIVPKGGREFEQWLVHKNGKANGEYSEWYTRTEFEFGLTDRFQLAAYLNARKQNVFRTNADGETAADYVPEQFSFDQPFARYRDSRFVSASLEAIYQLRNPLIDGYGLAVYAEPSLGPRFRELELRLLLQKNFLDDRLVVAANVILESEEKLKTGVVESAQLAAAQNKDDDEGLPVRRWDKNNEFITRIGASYLFSPGWRVGSELSRWVEFDGHTFARNKREHCTWFFGPTLAFANQDFFASISLEHQLPWVKVYEDEYEEDVVGDRLYGSERSRNQWTIKVGFPF
jgi:hypothetical protein